jgi:hypothetical protein
MEVVKIKIVKRGDSFVGHHYYGEKMYLELGLHKESDFSKVLEGNVVYAIRVSEMITVNQGKVPTSWSFFKVV